MREKGLGMSTQQRFQSIVDRLQSTASTKTVYGEAVEVKGKTIIPVAKVGYFFGMCSYGKRPEEEETDETRSMGGGLSVRPVGVLEVTQGETRFIPIGLGRKLVGALVLGLLLGMAIANRRRRDD
jgi:uncharacterized spore protein YtfJ